MGYLTWPATPGEGKARITCMLFGHITRWAGHPYLQQRVGGYDGIGRRHDRLVCECDRCGTPSTIARVHAPAPSDPTELAPPRIAGIDPTELFPKRRASRPDDQRIRSAQLAILDASNFITDVETPSPFLTEACVDLGRSMDLLSAHSKMHERVA